MSVDKTPCLNSENVSSGSAQAGRLFQTDILRGTSKEDWTWNQVRVGDLVKCTMLILLTTMSTIA